MTLVAAALFVNAAFNALTWPTFYRRVAKDPRALDQNGRATRFLAVHLVLFIVGMTIAVLSLVLGIAALAGVLD